eukprot:TRINITY_DN2732_c0_g1_i3.p3 TRINITY_DN2732_c0_g1~~TRINITY_DN2732_c0_g1_i3.p3  ORF type:complete len:124 (+),score=35.09 TRINITY_DN2732_c0_g1_i3:433-804(+)
MKKDDRTTTAAPVVDGAAAVDGVAVVEAAYSCLALLRAREYLSKLLVDSLVAYASDARASALCRKRAYVWADLEVWEADGLRLPAEGNISGNWVRCTDALLQHNNVGLYWSTPGKGLAECVHS